MDGFPDLKPSFSEKDTVNLPGNHVILSCILDSRRVEVVLAHLRNGSVEVDSGDQVIPGQPVGRVGNSGNTTEPHLHIHAYDPQTREGIPILFHGRFPVRNDEFTASPSSRRSLLPNVRGVP